MHIVIFILKIHVTEPMIVFSLKDASDKLITVDVLLDTVRVPMEMDTGATSALIHRDNMKVYSLCPRNVPFQETSLKVVMHSKQLYLINMVYS